MRSGVPEEAMPLLYRPICLPDSVLDIGYHNTLPRTLTSPKSRSVSKHERLAVLLKR